MSFARAIRTVVETGVFMSLGARAFRTDAAGHTLIFDATVLPMTKAGRRASAPRTMQVEIGADEVAEKLTIQATYPGRGAAKYGPPVVHCQWASRIEDLNKNLLALDYDGDEDVLNPDYATA